MKSYLVFTLISFAMIEQCAFSATDNLSKVEAPSRVSRPAAVSRSQRLSRVSGVIGVSRVARRRRVSGTLLKNPRVEGSETSSHSDLPPN